MCCYYLITHEIELNLWKLHLMASLPVVIKRRWLWPFVFSLMYISVMIDLCTLSGVLFYHFFAYIFECSQTRVLFWALHWSLFLALSGESTSLSAFLSTLLSTSLSTLGREYFFEHSLEHFFECSRVRVLFWSTFLSTLSTQKSTLGISAPTSYFGHFPLVK